MTTYRNLEIDKLVRVCAHLVVKAEPVLPNLIGREDKVALSLLDPIEDHLLVRSNNLVVNVERATGLYLFPSIVLSVPVVPLYRVHWPS